MDAGLIFGTDTMNCGCRIHFNVQNSLASYIEYCPLHRHTREMAALLYQVVSGRGPDNVLAYSHARPCRCLHCRIVTVMIAMRDDC